MSIGKLAEIYNDYFYKSQSALNVSKFMQMTIDILIEQAYDIQKLQKQLANKEDKIDVNNIKEVKRLNG